MPLDVDKPLIPDREPPKVLIVEHKISVGVCTLVIVSVLAVTAYFVGFSSTCSVKTGGDAFTLSCAASSQVSEVASK